MMGLPACVPGFLEAKTWARFFAMTAIIWSLLVGLLVFSASAGKEKQGKVSTPIDELRKGSLAADPDLAAALTGWSKAIYSGDGVGAVDQGAIIMERIGAMGSRNNIPAAALAVAVGKRALESFNYEGALMAGQLATHVAPDYSDGFFFLATANFAKDKKNVNAILPQLINGAKATVNNKLEQANLISLLIKFAFISTALGFMAAFITLLVMYRNAFSADIASFIPGGADSKLQMALGILTALVPLAVGGPFLFTLALPLFVWPYLRKSEKTLVIAFAVFCLVAPLAFKQMAKSVILRSDATYRALYLLSMDSWDHEAKYAIDSQLVKEPNSPLFLLAKGLTNKMSKDKGAALEAYDRLLAKSPNNEKILVNKGNVYFQDKDFEMAAKTYEQATKANSSSAAAFYMLSVAYEELLANEKRAKAYEKALSLDAKSTNEWQLLYAQYPDRPEKKVFDFLVTAQDIASFEQTFQARTETLAEGLWSAYFGGFSLDLYRKLSLVYIGAIVVVFLFWERTRIPHQTCLTCGAVFHPPMRMDMTTPKCNQCVAAQSSRAGVAGVKKDLKKKEIREYIESKSDLAGLLDRALPGVGRIYGHSPVPGILFLLATSLLLFFAGTLLYNDIIAASVPPMDAAKRNWPALAAVAVYWLIANTVFHKE